ncbi:MAG: ArnT family glycosyltransferase, partial [Cyanobium sp.]
MGAILVLWLLAVCLALIGLGNVPLRDWDEAIVARVSLELSRSPWMGGLLPTYLGETYANKPPGLHLAIATAIQLWHWAPGHGPTDLPPEWVVRIVPALASSLLVPLLGLVNYKLRPSRPDAAVATALIALTLLPLARHGRLAMLDGSQLSAMALVWLGLLGAGNARAQALRGGLLAGVGGSCLLLLKAPVAVPVLAVGLGLRHQDRILGARAWRWLLGGLALALLPGIAWHGWHLLARG